jgi:hypothetical protein
MNLEKLKRALHIKKFETNVTRDTARQKFETDVTRGTARHMSHPDGWKKGNVVLFYTTNNLQGSGKLRIL